MTRANLWRAACGGLEGVVHLRYTSGAPQVRIRASPHPLQLHRPPLRAGDGAPSIKAGATLLPKTLADQPPRSRAVVVAALPIGERTVRLDARDGTDREIGLAREGAHGGANGACC